MSTISLLVHYHDTYSRSCLLKIGHSYTNMQYTTQSFTTLQTNLTECIQQNSSPMQLSMHFVKLFSQDCAKNSNNLFTCVENYLPVLFVKHSLQTATCYTTGFSCDQPCMTLMGIQGRCKKIPCHFSSNSVNIQTVLII